MEPILERVSQEFAGRVQTVRVNADEHPDFARDLRILTIPSMVVFEHGNERARRVGAQNHANLHELYTATAEGTKIQSMSQRTRFIRIAIAGALVLMAQELTLAWPAYVAAGAVFFSAVHDRCPAWQALKRTFTRNAA
jgi:thioredoxin 1